MSANQDTKRAATDALIEAARDAIEAWDGDEYLKERMEDNYHAIRAALSRMEACGLAPDTL